MGKISAWYDNEWGFSNRMCDIAEVYSSKFLMQSVSRLTTFKVKKLF